MVASAISFFNTGDQVVVVARPTCRPPRYTGTAVRDAAAVICGARRGRSYGPSTAGQLISSPAIWRAGPRRGSAASAARPTNGPASSWTRRPSTIWNGENFFGSDLGFL